MPNTGWDGEPLTRTQAVLATAVLWTAGTIARLWPTRRTR